MYVTKQLSADQRVLALIHQYLLKNLLRFFLKVFLRDSLRKPYYVRFINTFISLRIVHSCVPTLMDGCDMPTLSPAPVEIFQ